MRSRHKDTSGVPNGARDLTRARLMQKIARIGRNSRDARLGGSLRAGRGCTVILVSIALLPDPFSLVRALSWVPLSAGPTVDPLEAPRSLRAGLSTDLPLAVFAGALVAGSSFEPPLSVSPWRWTWRFPPAVWTRQYFPRPLQHREMAFPRCPRERAGSTVQRSVERRLYWLRRRRTGWPTTEDTSDRLSRDNLE